MSLPRGKVRLWCTGMVTVCVCLMLVASAGAHHGDAGYDLSTMVTVKGTVTDFEFVNPHVEIALDVKNEDGAVEQWQAEMNSPAILARAAGWNRRTLKAGDQVVMEGHRAKRGLKVIRVEKVSMGDGTEIFPKGGNGVTRF